MSDEIMLVFGEDGVAREYDDTWDITIHCESEEEQKAVIKTVLEKLNNSNQEAKTQLSAKDTNVPCKDLISRQDALDAIGKCTDIYVNNLPTMVDKAEAYKALNEVPSAQTTLCGYDIKHLMIIAEVLRKENLPPERITEVLTDIGRIVSIVRDEFEKTLRKAVEQCEI